MNPEGRLQELGRTAQQASGSVMKLDSMWAGFGSLGDAEAEAPREVSPAYRYEGRSASRVRRALTRHISGRYDPNKMREPLSLRRFT